METNLDTVERAVSSGRSGISGLILRLTLAYIGDGVYELIIRTILVKKGNCPVNQLHKKASSLVKAAAQSAMIEKSLKPDTDRGRT